MIYRYTIKPQNTATGRMTSAVEAARYHQAIELIVDKHKLKNYAGSLYVTVGGNFVDLIIEC